MWNFVDFHVLFSFRQICFQVLKLVLSKLVIFVKPKLAKLTKILKIHKINLILQNWQTWQNLAKLSNLPKLGKIDKILVKFLNFCEIFSELENLCQIRFFCQIFSFSWLWSFLAHKIFLQSFVIIQVKKMTRDVLQNIIFCYSINKFQWMHEKSQPVCSECPT